ncbi:MAG: hypothetical protein OXU62_05705, partial [Gammaproteobacteria bacterium]|nr:hypothetical protein [Gammaproteobacteria bacterium]
MKPAAQFTPPPPPAIRGIISGALLAATAALTLTAAPPADAQTARTYTFTASVNGGPACTDCRADEGDQFALTFTLDSIGSSFVAGVRMPAISFGGTAVHGDDFTGGTRRADFRGGDVDLTAIRSFTIVTDGEPEPDETITVAVPVPFVSQTSDTYTTTSTDITITIAANDGHPDQAPVTPPVVTPGPAPGPATDNPTARAERLDAPVAAVAR